MAHHQLPSQAPALVHHDTKSKSISSLSLQTLPIPAPTGAGEHLIQIKAVALTNGELTWPEPGLCRPAIPGYEMSGIVVSAPAASPFQPGAEVCARTDFERQGNARPYSVALTPELGRKPGNISWEAAATVPLSALTAWQALFDRAGLAPPGQDTSSNASRSVLVTAAAGGVGVFAVQLAREAGVGRIVGTCGPANAELVRSLGAHQAVDYTRHGDLSAWIRQPGNDKFDLVVDGVGNASAGPPWTCVKEGGLLVSLVGPPEGARPATGVDRDVRGLFFIVEAEEKQLDRIGELVEAGRVKAVVDSVYPLDEYREAFGKIERGRLTGKVVLRL